MTYAVARKVVEGFYDAVTRRDFGAVATYIDDNIVWSISGPVDLLPFCGERRGKQAVLDVLEFEIPGVLPNREFLTEAFLVDGDRAAILGRVHAIYGRDSRPISYRTTHFMRFRNDRLIEYLSVADSFDAAEQVLGHRIDAQPSAQAEPNRSNLFAI
jgi:ketosteroid isomerase-like protein